LAEFDELDEELDPDPPWTSQYEVQEIPDMEYIPDEHVPPIEDSAPNEAGNEPKSGDPDPSSIVQKVDQSETLKDGA
jgi:hypothetical protein